MFGSVVHLPVGAVTPSSLSRGVTWAPLGGITWAVSEHISSGYDQIWGAAVDGSGLYAVGSDYTPSNKEWRLEKRSLTTGATIWGVSENLSSGSDEARGVAVDTTGVYVVGWDSTPGNPEWRVEKRSLTTGTITWARSEDISSSYDYAYGVVVDGSGVYIAGFDENATGNKDEWRVEKRSLTTGAVLWSYSEHLSSGDDFAGGVAVDGSGVYVVGSDYAPGSDEWRLEKRSLTSGAILWAQSEDISSGDDYAGHVAVDGSGVYVAGYDQTAGVGRDGWRVEKRSLTTGATIWATSEHIGGLDGARGVAVDASGVYVVGFDNSTANHSWEWRVEKRSLTSGAIMWTQFEDISNSYDSGNAVAVDGSGVYVAGYDQNTPGSLDEWRVEKRSKPQTDASFTVNNGNFWSLNIITTVSDFSPLPPAGLTFPYGIFNYTIGNLTAGASVNVTATLPAPLPNGPVLMYWTFHNGVWRQLPSSQFTVAANRTLFVLNLTDGKVPDDKDETGNGGIVDLGGVAYAYNVTLVAGWNLVSLPVVPVDPTATNMLRSLAASGKLVSVYGYTGTPRTWKYYLPGKASTLTTLNDGVGYWVYMRSADTLYVNGTVIPPASNPPAYALVSGWNLVGFKSQPNATEPKTVSQFLGSISGSYDGNEVWLYNSSSHIWAQMGASDTLHPGDAFWVRMTAAATLYPE
jgi:hypothetical protein